MLGLVSIVAHDVVLLSQAHALCEIVNNFVIAVLESGTAQKILKNLSEKAVIQCFMGVYVFSELLLVKFLLSRL